MKYSLELTDQEAAQIAEAERQGIAIAPLIRKLIASLPIGKTPSNLSFTERQELQAKAFAESGTTEEELSEYVNDFVHRVVRGGERQPDGTMKYKP